MSRELELLRELEKRECEDSYYEFLLRAYNVIHPEEYLDENWHLKYLCDKLQAEAERIIKGEKRKKHLIINIPPRSLKSELCTAIFPAWVWVRKQRMKFIGVSYSARLSIDHNVYTRRIIESEWYQRNWEVKISADVNTKSKFDNVKGGSRMATSVGGSVTGMGGDIIIVDDPIDPKRAASDVTREEANTFFDMTLNTRLNTPSVGIFIVVMQRLHEMDLTGHLLDINPEGWEHICIPAELSDDVKPVELKEKYVDNLFFPRRFPKERLDELKKSLRAYGYSGQIMQRPSPEEGGMLHVDWFNIINEAPKDLVWDIFVDSAYTAKQKNDPTALMAVAYDKYSMYIKESSQVWLEFPELKKEIPRFAANNGCNERSRILIEPKASGLSLVQELKRESDLNIIELPPPKDDKETRVNAATPFIESGRCYIIKSGWNENFLTEISMFPNGTHDDQVDNLTAAVNYYKKKKKKRRLS